MENIQDGYHVIEANKGIQIWWQMIRPHTLTATFVPVVLGTTLAVETANFHFGLFLAMLFSSLFIQAATNMFNEYYDFKRGLDTRDSVGISGTIVRDGIQPKTVMNLALAYYGISLLLGVYICMITSIYLAIIGIICMSIGFLYTGGPFPISYTPLGELFSGFFMGIVILLISFYIQAGTLTEKSFIFSIPIFFLISSINLSNNIRDHVGDKKNGRRTVPVLLGKKKATVLLALMFIFSYLWVIGLIIFNFAPIWTAAVIFSLAKPVRAIRVFNKAINPIELAPAMKATAQTNTSFGLLFSIGIFAGHYF